MDRETQLHLILDMLKEVIERGVEVPLKTAGLSMQPSIYGGEWVVVRRVATREVPGGGPGKNVGTGCALGVGDIVIYQAGSIFIAHRVIRRRERDGQVYLAVKGDAQLVAEEIAAEQVVARVVAVERGDRRIDLNTPRRRLANRLIAGYASWVDILFRAMPRLPAVLRPDSGRLPGRLVGLLVSSLNRLPARLLGGR
jgi:signal peptidase I